MKIMSSFLNILMNRILRDRIKPFVIIEFIILIPYLIISFYALKGHTTNFSYLGIGQVNFAIILFLMGIEYILLKKKILSILWFIMTLIWVYLSIQTFGLLNTKR
jgi:hypothetical protein